MSARKPKTLNADGIPRPGDPDRKRVLNVLAQRRYRKRRRDKIAALEAQTLTRQPNTSTANQSGTLPSPPSSDNASITLDEDGLETIISNSGIGPQDVVISPATLSLSASTSTNLSFTVQDFTSNDIFVGFNGNLDSPIDLSTCVDSDFFQTTAGFDFDSSTISSPPNVELSGDVNLEVPSLKVMKAILDIAKMLGCEKELFDPAFTHILKPITRIPIPSWLQPTAAQQMIPHHPLFDLLPWPSVRTKLICAFAQPVETRPPSARDTWAFMALVSDMDDTSEGLRVVGNEGLQDENWEVGQQFFTNWWWAFEPSIINQSNLLRDKRGATRLSLPGLPAEKRG